MAVGKSFLDQYSVFCVFGSVVGCVVVPLITQSVESLIFSAIVISLTANRFSKKVVLEPSIKGENKEQKSIKGSKDKDINLTSCKKKKKPPSSNINGTQNVLYHQLTQSEQRKQYQEEVERRESEKLKELERKEEEKREKKLKKKEERLKRKNNEKKENENKKDKSSSSSPSSSVVDKSIRSGVTFSIKQEEPTINNKNLKLEKSQPLAPTTTAPSPTNTPTSQYNMNSNRTKKYDYYRPNIPRFARQAAKQRQLGFQQFQQFPTTATHQSTVPVQQSSSPLRNSNRSSPSPDNVINLDQSVTTSPQASLFDNATIQPKVKSVIGCRKSPEPSTSLSNGPLNTVNSETTGDRCSGTQKPEDEMMNMPGSCYSLFGENTESQDFLSIIRQETGLQQS